MISFMDGIRSNGASNVLFCGGRQIHMISFMDGLEAMEHPMSFLEEVLPGQ
jgi:prepilin-type processing-associated H-X9-DG protein